MFLDFSMRVSTAFKGQDRDLRTPFSNFPDDVA